MATAKSQLSASRAVATALAIGLMAILGPLVGLAGASHTTIDATPNSDTNPVGTNHSVTATTSVPDVLVNFNRESGPNSDDAEPLGTPSDFECTTDAVAPHQCAFSYEGTGGAGTDQIRVWSDEGSDDDVFQEAEPNEVVTKAWFEQDPAQATLNCDPETGENPSMGPGSRHEITCTVLDQTGEPFLGAIVNFENETPTVNDPDDNATRDDPRFGGPDNNCGTSDRPNSAGTCTTIYPSEEEEGTATIRGWVAQDLDDSTDESDSNEAPVPDDQDNTDVVQKTWTFPCRNDQPDDNIFVGTNGEDEITGTPGDDFICARGGDDRVNTLGGDDFVLLGLGNDLANAGGGRDTVRGGGGRDSVGGGGGVDGLEGEAGSDNLRGGSNGDVISGGNGNDTLGGGKGGDRLDGEAGSDNLRGGSGRGRDRMTGGSENDFLSGGAGEDFLGGGRGADEVRGGDGADTFEGGTGSDDLSGENGNDFLVGRKGGDDLAGGAGDDFLFGLEGRDELSGGSGRDQLNGGPDIDRCRGGAGRDRLSSCER